MITAFNKRARFGIRCALWRASTGLATVGRVSKGNPTVKYSWKLGRICGIDVNLHWSFLIVPAWVALTWLATGSVLVSGVSASLFLLAVFVYALLYDFGHAARSVVATTLRASREASLVRPQPCSSVLTLPAHARADEVTGVLFSPQNYFPVLQGSEIVGVLSKSRLLRALANEHGDRLVAELMTGDSGPEPSLAYTHVEMRS